MTQLRTKGAVRESTEIASERREGIWSARPRRRNVAVFAGRAAGGEGRGRHVMRGPAQLARSPGLVERGNWLRPQEH